MRLWSWESCSRLLGHNSGPRKIKKKPLKCHLALKHQVCNDGGNSRNIGLLSLLATLGVVVLLTDSKTSQFTYDSALWSPNFDLSSCRNWLLQIQRPEEVSPMEAELEGELRRTQPAPIRRSDSSS